jgi:secreted PhoX family phosphatase
MQDDDLISNPSNNTPFAAVLGSLQNRRNVLSGGIQAATSFLAAAAFNGVAHAAEATQAMKGSLMTFKPVPVAGGGGLVPRISDDYVYEVILPWGDPIAPGSLDTLGIGHDGMAYYPLGNSSKTRNAYGLLVLNHEYGDNTIVLGKALPGGLADVRKSQYAHGVSVVEISRAGLSGTKWTQVNYGNFARRIHVNSPVSFSGPAAGSAFLTNEANNEFLGTVNNCANGTTPWGTYLTCEENFNAYFGAKNAWTATSMQARYGLSARSSYGWHLYDERFDLSNPYFANESNRFGWVVEIDPRNPQAKPVKRTALGRFKHEGAALVTGKGGKVVAYMGDDERFEYIYKYVSADNWNSMLARGVHPLDDGKLYVAKFNADGTGQWLELSIDNPALHAAFTSQAEVLTYVRRASDLLGATPMDRPEWTTVAPNGLVYCTLTNNTSRGRAGLPGVDATNPIAPNNDGHIIRWLDSEHHVGTSFQWDILLIAKNTHGTEDSFASPDGLWADPDGRLFIQTDGSQKDGLNDQLLVVDIRTGEIRRLFEGVFGCEVTGITTTPDRRVMFCNLQHPDPSTSVPRDATIVITRRDGGIIGS